jgi:Vacuolar protein sorting-associated protein 62
VANLPVTPAADGNDHHYWLELKDNASRSGNLASAVAYVHAKPAAIAGSTDIAFWFFYAFNGPGAAHVFPFRDYLRSTCSASIPATGKTSCCASTTAAKH